MHRALHLLACKLHSMVDGQLDGRYFLATDQVVTYLFFSTCLIIYISWRLDHQLH